MANINVYEEAKKTLINDDIMPVIALEMLEADEVLNVTEEQYNNAIVFNVATGGKYMNKDHYSEEMIKEKVYSRGSRAA